LVTGPRWVPDTRTDWPSIVNLTSTSTPSKEDTHNDSVNEQQQEPRSQADRLPPIVLTAQTNLIQLQKQLTELVKGKFEFCNPRNATRIVTEDMAGFSAIKSHLDNKRMFCFTFYQKSQKPVKAVIRHLPPATCHLPPDIVPLQRIYMTD
jgi:hypothetical protein